MRGALVLRVEDLDTPRVVAGSEQRQIEDLRWLGFDFEEAPDRGGGFGPYRQSERQPLYEAALASLSERGLTYFCDCSRADIARVASAPHAGEEGPHYPGTCREFGMETRKFRRKPAIRLRVPAQPTVCVDGLSGACSESVLDLMGDFVLRRGDGVFSYQFAVAVDDSAMEISEVVRGADLAASASCQVLLMRLLGAPAPRYWHVPLLCDNLGERFSKRQASLSVRTLRNRGIPPTTILAALCDLYGIACHAGASPLLAAARALETPSPDVMSILTGPSLRLAEGALG